MSKMMCLRNDVVPAEQMMCLRKDVPLRGNAGDGSIHNALRDALGILSGKITFKQSKPGKSVDLPGLFFHAQEP